MGYGVGIGFRAGAADDDFDSVTDRIDEAAVAGGESDGEQIGFAGFTESEGVAFGVGGEAATEVAMEGLVVGEVNSRGLAVKSDSADATFLAEDGATDLMVAVGAGGGGGLGQTEGKLDPFFFHPCGHKRLVADVGRDGKRGKGAMGKRGEEVGRSWIRTSEGVSQQIYSLPRLATSVSARKREPRKKERWGQKRSQEIIWSRMGFGPF